MFVQVIDSELYHNLGISMACVFVTTLFLLADILGSVQVMLCVLMTLVSFLTLTIYTFILQLLWLGSRFGKHCNNYVSKNLRKEKKRNIYTLWHNHKLKLVYSSKLKLITQSNPHEKHYQTIPLVCQLLNYDIKLWLRSFRNKKRVTKREGGVFLSKN